MRMPLLPSPFPPPSLPRLRGRLGRGAAEGREGAVTASPNMPDSPIADPLAWRSVKTPSLADLEILAREVSRACRPSSGLCARDWSSRSRTSPPTRCSTIWASKASST